MSLRPTDAQKSQCIAFDYGADLFSRNGRQTGISQELVKAQECFYAVVRPGERVAAAEKEFIHNTGFMGTYDNVINLPHLLG